VSVTWIEASAGTGKTFTLVQTVVELVCSGVPAERILLVTFTERATAELKTRIRTGLRDAFKRTGHPAVAQALEDLASLSVSTIHGFCRALLTQFPLESGVSFEPELVDQGRQWRRLLRDELRPRLAELDANLLAWAGLEDEEDLLALAQQALSRRVFSLPLVHPDRSERERFEAVRGELEKGRGPFWDAVGRLRSENLPEDPQSLGSEFSRVVSRADWFKKPYEKLRALASARTFRDLLELTDDKSLEYLAKWQEGSTLWKKGLTGDLLPPFSTLREAAGAFTLAAESLASALPPGTGIRNFLRGAARHQLLEGLCRPVLERPSVRELTFHDLIDRVHRLVTAGDSGLKVGASARWQAVLIDEFQDTDAEQWEIFSSLFLTEQHDLVLVGDPKQSIYRFRGADLDLYRRVRAQVLAFGAQTRRLTENYRSTQPMIEAVNARFAPGSVSWDHPEDFAPSTKGDKPVGALVRQGPDGRVVVPPLALFSQGDEASWHRHLAATALELLDGRHGLDDGTGGDPVPLTPGDLLVLVRTKREAWTLYRLLTACGLPAVVGGSGGLLRTREAHEVLLFLKALESPRSLSAARALAWTRAFAGVSVEVLAPALELAQDDRRAGAYLRAFRLVAARALDAGVSDGGGLEQLLGRPGGARVVTNTEHVLELVQERHHRGDVASGKAALSLETWMQSRLQEDEVDLRRDGEARTIRLMTVHAAKGLEAPVVLHGFPSDRLRGFTEPWLIDKGVDFLLTQDGRDAEKRHEAAEALRLSYVAQTRARTHQVLFDAAAGGPSVPVPAPEALRPWTAPGQARPAVPDLAPAVDGLESRHPWVESHSGLWRRATRDEAETRTVWDRPQVSRDDEAEAEPESLADTLPAGPAFGDLVHDILEASDYAAWAPSAAPVAQRAVREVVQEHCHRHRASFQGRDLTRPLEAWLSRLMNSPLALAPGTEPVTFTSLERGDTRRELEFHLPLSLSTPESFWWGGRAFAVHPGYLTGRIDLLFRWRGRLYLADWKTNRLAPGQEPSELMAEAGYDLQAQWYWEALQRLCRLQHEPLEPGGVLYVFLRGGDDRPRGVFLSPAELSAVGTLSPFLGEAHRE
jgi:exodeoxyribonuclease V beta subunit